MQEDIDKFHFYGSNAGEWYTSNNIGAVIQWMTRSDMVYSLWLVPGPEETPYEIRAYAPDVEGRVFLGTYRKKTRIS